MIRLKAMFRQKRKASLQACSGQHLTMKYFIDNFSKNIKDLA